MQSEIRSFAFLLPSPVNHAIWQCDECELFRKVQRFWQRKVWTQRHSGGEKLRCNFFWQGKAQNSSPILRCTFLARRSAKLIANFSAKTVTSLPSFSLSLYLSLSLSPNVPHAQYRKRFRASYNTEREREIDGSDVIIVALKLAMNLHFPLPIRTTGDELTLSLAKNSLFSFLPSHFPSLPSRRGHHGGAEIRNEFTLSIAKKIFALRLCSPSFKWHEPRDEWSKTQDKWSNLAQSFFVLPIEKMNQINTKNYWK